MSNAQVLIVEDEIIVARDLGNRLTNMGYTVCRIALSGAEAISMATEMQPDIILMDIKLGEDMDGIEAASKIRNHLDIPVIYLTAYSDQDTLQRAKVTEPFGYLLKPYRTRELQTSIEMVLHKHKLETQLRMLVAKFDRAEEQSRRRIGSFLHDYVNHGLLLLKMRIAALKEKLPSAELGGALDQICESIGRMIGNTQSLVEDLNPTMLHEMGFEAAAEWLTRYELGFENAVEWLSERTRAKHDFVTSFEDDGKHKPLDQEVSTALFRSLRELLVNVAKHAQARNAKVCVRRVGTNIEVQIQDDGVGFEPGEVRSRRDLAAGFGFFGIEERLKHFGGRLQLQSEPGSGTRITLTAPLKLDA